MQLPFNLFKWIEENKQFLKPPVGNKVLLENDEFLVMAVGGPNARNDYHFNEGEEFFFQIKGDIVVKVQDNGLAKDINIREGEVFLLPSRVPHSPIRPSDTVGIVIERKRTHSENDGLQWYCPKCNHKLYEEYFHLKSIEKDFLPVFRKFNTSESLRTCTSCGYITPADERYL